MSLAPHLTRAAFRSLRLLDVPSVLAQVRFAELRRRYYAAYWSRTAQEIGATCETLEFGYTRLGRSGTSVIVRGAEVRLDDHLTLDLMGNKAMTYRLMTELGYAVPRHLRFRVGGLAAAEAFLRDLHRPLVVKPVAGTGGGRGVTTGITDAGTLARAAWSASRFDPDLLAEEQLDGHSYRLLFLDGRLVDAIRRDPPRVTGDGHHNIAKLVADENRKRLSALPFSALSPLAIDRDSRLYLAAQHLTPRSVPAMGETIIVKRAVNQNNAAENVVVRDSVHPSTIASGARLCAALGVRFAGIDILARDIALPLTRDNGLIGEVNTTPGLHHHHLVANAEPGLSVAGQVAEHLLSLAGEQSTSPRLNMAAA